MKIRVIRGKELRVAVIIPSLRDLAPVQVALAVAGQLARSGHTITVYYFKDQYGIEKPVGVSFKKIHFLSNIPWHEFDIIHSHGFVPDTYVAFRKPSRCRAKTVTTIHNYVFPELRLLYNQIISLSLGSLWISAWRRLDQLVVLTDDAKKYYASRLPDQKISRIYNGKNIIPDETKIALQHKQLIDGLRSQFGYVIGSNAALIPRKRIDILIRHLSRVKTGCLIILGEGPERKNLENLVSKFKLQDRVKFLGYIPNEHSFNELYDISAFPSISEGFSLSLIEAACHKKKIVCSDIPSFREAFTDKEVTFFDSEHELTIDEAIREALMDDEKALNAFRKVKESYSEESMGREYENLFKQLIHIESR